MVRRNSLLGFAVALGPIAAAVYLSVSSTVLFLVAIIAVILGGAITRSGKAGAVAGFLAVWLPSFSIPLILLLTIGSADPSIGFAVIALVFILIGLMIASFVLGAFGALIGGVAGWLVGRKFPLVSPIANVSISKEEYDYLRRREISSHMLIPPEDGDEGHEARQ
jgi:hypothetical protein